MNWRDLGAGSELDEVIAEKAGLSIVTGTAAVWSPGCTREYIHEWIETVGGPMRIPAYSTDLNAAFELFENDPFFHVPLEWNLFSDTCDDYTCELGHWGTDPGDRDDLSSGNAKTPALAICYAWLTWVERTDH